MTQLLWKLQQPLWDISLFFIMSLNFDQKQPNVIVSLLILSVFGGFSGVIVQRTKLKNKNNQKSLSTTYFFSSNPLLNLTSVNEVSFSVPETITIKAFYSILFLNRPRGVFRFSDRWTVQVGSMQAPTWPAISWTPHCRKIFFYGNLRFRDGAIKRNKDRACRENRNLLSGCIDPQLHICLTETTGWTLKTMTAAIAGPRERSLVI